MPQQAPTAFASRWTKMATTFGLLSAVAVSATCLAAPAAAGTDTFLQTLRPIYAYMSESQLLSAGNQVCRLARSGVPASEIVPVLVNEYALSASASYEIVSASTIYLGC